MASVAGERQRLELATHMAEKGVVYEPAKSLTVIAHHQAVMAHADWIIDLGPGAGHRPTLARNQAS